MSSKLVKYLDENFGFFVGTAFIVTVIGLSIWGVMVQSNEQKPIKMCQRYNTVLIAAGQNVVLNCESKLYLLKELNHKCYDRTIDCYAEAIVPNDLKKCDAMCLTSAFDR